jgi:site-specific recombinase XerD
MIYKQEKFMLYLQIKGQSPRTREGVLGGVINFEKWMKAENIKHEQISHNDILAYINTFKQKGNKAITIQKVVLNLKHYYTFLMQEDDVADNPCSNIVIKGVQRKYLYKTYSKEELEEVYKTFATAPLSKHSFSAFTHKQHYVILGLIIYQGLRVNEIKCLKLENLQLREGKITIESTKRTAGRILKLEAHQLYDLMDYVQLTRKEVQEQRVKQKTLIPKVIDKDLLFISPVVSANLNGTMRRILHKLRMHLPQLSDLKQLRGSVISNWLKEYDLRKVQYFAGHKYVSSTEAYKVNNLEDLKEEVNRYHPDF